ncbi:MAG: hypothetical protein ACLFS0_03635, partial [Bacteroidales bacterium]
MRLRRFLFCYLTFCIISILALLTPKASAGQDAPTQDTLRTPIQTTGFPMESSILLDLESFPITGLSLTNPKPLSTHFEYDPATGYYIMTRRVDDMVIGRPQYLTFDQYMEYDLERGMQRYWQKRSKPQDFERDDGLIPEIHVGGEFFDRIFGGSTIDIRPSGSAELIFGIMSNYREDPALDEQRRRTTNFDFQQKIQLALEAEIGTKINLGANYNTESSFDFENRMKLEY